MIAKVKQTGEILKDVKVFEEDESGKPLFYIDRDTAKTYEAHELEIGCDEPADVLTEQKIFDDYQERSATAGNRAENLALVFVILLCCQVIGGSRIRELYVIAAGGIGYMLLHSLQALWQAFAMWLFKQKVTREKLQVDDYPEWLGGIAWAFYWAKMAVITVTSVYTVWHFMQLL